MAPRTYRTWRASAAWPRTRCASGSRTLVEHGFLVVRDDTYSADAEKMAGAMEDVDYSGGSGQRHGDGLVPQLVRRRHHTRYMVDTIMPTTPTSSMYSETKPSEVLPASGMGPRAPTTFTGLVLSDSTTSVYS